MSVPQLQLPFWPMDLQIVTLGGMRVLALSLGASSAQLLEEV